jgi:protoheme IX farnesyltransferase
MATEPTITAPYVAAEMQPFYRPNSRVLAGYWALTKPEVNFLIAITVFAAFCLAQPTLSQSFPFLRLIRTLLGTLLVASGSGALNQFIERRFDAQMRRTARRPLVVGSIVPFHGLWFGILLSGGGAIYLALAVNWLSSILAVLTLISYLGLYTPLKRKTALCTLVGAFPGAMPALIGWAAASGSLSLGAWILFAILYLWQVPHFMAIAWIYREDYDRAGYMVLPRGKSRNYFIAWQSVLPLLVLILLSSTPTLLGYAGRAYFIGALLLSFGFLYCGARFVIHRSNAIARQLLLASIIYLPSVFLLMVLDKT